MGLPTERPTAQPPQDFYVYMLPLFGANPVEEPQKDEVYFRFQSSPKFTELLKAYAGAKEMEAMSAQGETRSTYAKRATSTLRDLRRYLEENKTVCFQISYLGSEKPVLDYLRGARMNEITVRDVIGIVASKALSAFFNDRYPNYPVFKKPVTKDNQATMRAEAINAIAGKATQLGTSLLESLGLLLDGRSAWSIQSTHLTTSQDLPSCRGRCAQRIRHHDLTQRTGYGGQRVQTERYLDVSYLDSTCLQRQLCPRGS
jgi:hypothetical protein